VPRTAAPPFRTLPLGYRTMSRPPHLCLPVDAKRQPLQFPVSSIVAIGVAILGARWWAPTGGTCPPRIPRMAII